MGGKQMPLDSLELEVEVEVGSLKLKLDVGNGVLEDAPLVNMENRASVDGKQMRPWKTERVSMGGKQMRPW